MLHGSHVDSTQSLVMTSEKKARHFRTIAKVKFLLYPRMLLRATYIVGTYLPLTSVPYVLSRVVVKLAKNQVICRLSQNAQYIL